MFHDFNWGSVHVRNAVACLLLESQELGLITVILHRIGMRMEGKAEPDNSAVFEGMQDVKVHYASSQQLSVFLTLIQRP